MIRTILLCCVLLGGCGAACPVINVVADAAKTACPVVVEYLGEDGQVYKIQVPRELVLQTAAVAAQKQGLAAPKGSPAEASGVIEPPVEK